MFPDEASRHVIFFDVAITTCGEELHWRMKALPKTGAQVGGYRYAAC